MKRKFVFVDKPDPTAKRGLRVVRTATGKVEHTVDVTGKTDRVVEKVLSGMLDRIDTDNFHVEDSADDKS